jgi:hypothetical protein
MLYMPGIHMFWDTSTRTARWLVIDRCAFHLFHTVDVGTSRVGGVSTRHARVVTLASRSAACRSKVCKSASVQVCPAVSLACSSSLIVLCLDLPCSVFHYLPLPSSALLYRPLPCSAVLCLPSRPSTLPSAPIPASRRPLRSRPLTLLQLHLQHLHHALHVVLLPLDGLLEGVEVGLDKGGFGGVVGYCFGFGLRGRERTSERSE